MPQLTIETLRRLRTLSQFSNAQLGTLAKQLLIETATSKQQLIKCGETEQFSLYLLSGSIKTIAKDGTIKNIEAELEDDLSPIAHIRPSMYDVEADGNIQYIKITADHLTGFSQQLESVDGSMDVVTIDQTSEESELTIQLLQDINSDNIRLPSMPDVALRIQQAFSQSHIDTKAVARIIQSDPSITAKLIMIANSPLYSGNVQVGTLQDAIVRIGLEATRKQVIIYVVKELFKATSKDIKLKMQRLWIHSRRVAAFSRVLGKRTGLFDPEQAQLAGLIHDLGEIAILQYVQANPGLYEDSDKLMRAIGNLRPQITSMLLYKWNFSTELITVGEESENWFRNPDDEADLCDLVMVAQYHSFIGTEVMKRLPPISKLPAYAKLGLSFDEPTDIMAFMKESKAEVDIIEKLLGTV